MTTPLTLRDGSVIWVTEGLGAVVPVLDGGVFAWEQIVSLERVGRRRVAHISCDGKTYAAGVEPGRYILTHNVTAKP